MGGDIFFEHVAPQRDWAGKARSSFDGAAVRFAAIFPWVAEALERRVKRPPTNDQSRCLTSIARWVHLYTASTRPSCVADLAKSSLCVHSIGIREDRQHCLVLKVVGGGLSISEGMKAPHPIHGASVVVLGVFSIRRWSASNGVSYQLLCNEVKTPHV